MDELSPLESSLFALVKQYVGRQSIVLDAMKELRPDIIMRGEMWRSSMSPMDPEEWAEFRIKHLRKPQLGTWGANGEWEHYFHGGGCRLTHKQTGERIEWDFGDLNTFNIDWFVYYLQWLLKQTGDNEDIKIVNSALNYSEVIDQNELESQSFHQFLKMREQLLPTLEQLYAKGLLIRNTQFNQITHYTVVNHAP